MKERPILFSGPMVRAILEGRKTQTRRVVKNSINSLHVHGNPVKLYADWPLSGLRLFADGVAEFEIQCAVDDSEYEKTKCPYGVPGDRLWVRETFSETEAARTPGDEIPDWVNYVYRADYPDFEEVLQLDRIKWKPSIFMPRAASRILLEVVSVRVERLQDITEADAMAEGVEPDIDKGYWKGYVHPGVYDSAKKSFTSLWSSINGPDSWEQNPYVWVVEFKRIEP